MSKQITAKITALRALALENYEQDRGVMNETFGEEEYATAVAGKTTAKQAWEKHCAAVAAQYEAQAGYEADEQRAADAMEQAAATLAQAPAATEPPTVAGAPATPVLPVAVVVAGVQVSAAKNVLARAATLGNVPSALAAVRLVLGPVPCRVRVPYTQQCWSAIAAHIAQHGAATGQTLAGISTGDFLKYAVKNRWLAVAAG